MGTKMAPSYTNIFMGRLEKQLLQSVRLKPFSWLRFIDDIDMKWIHGRETLEAFLETANSFHSTIRFTAEVSNDKHVFLDTMSHLADDKVAVDLYTKPTDSHQYLLPTSCHPLPPASFCTTHQTHLLGRWGFWEKSERSLWTSQQTGLSKGGHWSSHREGQA